SAEWIMERPTAFGSEEMFPLCGFGSVMFQGAVAGTRHGERSLTGVDLYDMQDEKGDATCRAVLENSELLRISYGFDGPPVGPADGAPPGRLGRLMKGPSIS